MTDESTSIKLTANTIICREGDLDNNLYKIISGKILVCRRKNSAVTPLAYLKAGDFIGELAFLDNKTRSADVLTVEDSVIQKVPQTYFKKNTPPWLLDSYRFFSNWIRSLDEVINTHGIKKKNVASMAALSIDEQRNINDLLDQDQ